MGLTLIFLGRGRGGGLNIFVLKKVASGPHLGLQVFVNYTAEIPNLGLATIWNHHGGKFEGIRFGYRKLTNLKYAYTAK